MSTCPFKTLPIVLSLFFYPFSSPILLLSQVDMYVDITYEKPHKQKIPGSGTDDFHVNQALTFPVNEIPG